MRIGIVGVGQVGTALGAGFAAAGHEVIYGVRAGSKAAPHPGSRMDSVRAAVVAADAVVLATPWAAVADALSTAGDFAGKPLLDATNPLGPGLVLTHGHTTSGAEVIAATATNARVVKAFNTTGFENMANPRYGDSRAMMPIAGDDVAAVELAARLATDLGFEPVMLRALSRARELEPLAVLWIKLAMAWGNGRNIAFGLARRGPTSQDNSPQAALTRSITIVGSGNIGGALARAWLKLGHRVELAVRDPSAADVQALVKLGASAAPATKAARAAEVVVLAVPAGAVVGVAQSLALDDKVVVDCTNAIGKGFVLQFGNSTSSSEEIAKAVPRAKLVRSFNQQGAEVLRDPVFGQHRAANFVASDDPAARAMVRDLARDAGLDAIEAGPLASARYLEPMTVLWVSLSQAMGTRELAFTLLRR